MTLKQLEKRTTRQTLKFRLEFILLIKNRLLCVFEFFSEIFLKKFGDLIFCRTFVSG